MPSRARLDEFIAAVVSGELERIAHGRGQDRTHRIGTAAFHASSHQAMCAQPRVPKSAAGPSTRREFSVTASMGRLHRLALSGGLSGVYAPRIHCRHASQYLRACRSRSGLRASLTEHKRDVDMLS